jgi:hypothetical protein
MAITSKEINLGQLDQELGGKGLIGDFNDPKKKLVLPSENSDLTESELEAGIAVHVAIDENAGRKADRAALLAQLGITEEQAKLLLG